MTPDITFHRTPTRTIPLKSVPTYLGIINTFCYAYTVASSTPLKAACMMETAFYQFPGSGSTTHVAAQSHILRCSALIPDGPPEQ